MEQRLWLCMQRQSNLLSFSERWYIYISGGHRYIYIIYLYIEKYIYRDLFYSEPFHLTWRTRANVHGNASPSRPPRPRSAPCAAQPSPPGLPSAPPRCDRHPLGGPGEGRVGAPEINVQIAVELAPSLGLFDACGGFAAGCGGGCGAVLWKWALGGRGGDKAVGLCPWGEGKPHYSHSLPCGCWRGALPACPAAPQPLPTGLCPRVAHGHLQTPRTHSRSL